MDDDLGVEVELEGHGVVGLDFGFTEPLGRHLHIRLVRLGHGAHFEHLAEVALLLHLDKTLELFKCFILIKLVVSEAELEVTVREAKGVEDLCVKHAILDGGDTVNLLSGLLLGLASQLRVHFHLECHLLLGCLHKDLPLLGDRLTHLLNVSIHLGVGIIHFSVLVALLVILQVEDL